MSGLCKIMSEIYKYYMFLHDGHLLSCVLVNLQINIHVFYIILYINKL